MHLNKKKFVSKVMNSSLYKLHKMFKKHSRVCAHTHTHIHTLLAISQSVSKFWDANAYLHGGPCSPSGVDWDTHTTFNVLKSITVVATPPALHPWHWGSIHYSLWLSHHHFCCLNLCPGLENPKILPCCQTSLGWRPRAALRMDLPTHDSGLGPDSLTLDSATLRKLHWTKQIKISAPTEPRAHLGKVY